MCMQTQPCEIDLVLPKSESIDYLPLEKKPYTLEVILADVCMALNESVEIVSSKSRKREHVSCRFIYCFVAKKKTGRSLKSIGELVNGRDHTTVIHALQAVQDFFDIKDPGFIANWKTYLENSTLFTQYDFK